LAAPLDPAGFLPAARGTYRYEGSLTTPPCSEIVDWNVFGAPIEVAQADIDAFRAIFPMNARPLQAVNRRFLLRLN
ncbi:MAG: carbonic anhydrase family protein, partial [Rhizobiales bacterium]|nr:carbonic anhydrase family protein [Hyphomicrobiales bacterium]